MKHCLNLIPKKSAALLTNALLNMGYTKSVLLYEIQAYLSTGLVEELKSAKIPNSLIKLFKSTYQKYARQGH